MLTNSLTNISLIHIYGVIHGIYLACILFSIIVTLIHLYNKNIKSFQISLLSTLLLAGFTLYLFFVESMYQAPITAHLPPILPLLGKLLTPLTTMLASHIYIKLLSIRTLQPALYKYIYVFYAVLLFIALLIWFAASDKSAMLLINLNFAIALCAATYHAFHYLRHITFGRILTACLIFSAVNAIFFLFAIQDNIMERISLFTMLINHGLFAIIMSIITLVIIRSNHESFFIANTLRAQKEQHLLFELSRALNYDQLYLAYQPQIHITNNSICGLEALIRWKHPEKGNIPPNDFIVLAESQPDIIHQIARFVITRAIKKAAELSERNYPINVSINLSYKNLNPSIAKHIEKQLHKYHVPAERIILEITETTIPKDFINVQKTLTRLQSLGCKISLDDYGTGFSSLAQINSLKINELKIDRSLIKKASIDHDSAIIVDSTILMGHKLGLSIVAEGVEDNATLAFLKANNCDTAQGFGLAKPIPENELINWLDTCNYHVGHAH